MARVVTRGKRVIFQGQYGEELAHFSERGLIASPTHVRFRESWQQLPGLKAALETFTASVASAEMVAAMIANRNFSSIFTDVTTAGAVTFATGGGITVTTATGDASIGVIQPQLSTNQTALSVAQFLSQNSPWFSTWIKTGASIAKTRYALGFKLTNTDVPATDDDQAFFRFTDSLGTGDVSTTNWQFVSSRAGTDVFFDTGIAVAASTIYRLEIILDSGRVPHVYITSVQTNGNYARQEIALSAAAAAALTTAIAFKPYHIIAARGTTPGAKAITLLPDFELGHLAA